MLSLIERRWGREINLMMVRGDFWDSLVLAFLVDVESRDRNIFHLNVSIELLLLFSLILNDSLLLF